MIRHARRAALLLLAPLLAACSIPSWVPLVGKSPPPVAQTPTPPPKQATAPLISAGTPDAVDQEHILDRGSAS